MGRGFLKILLLMFFTGSFNAQNLINNPGFENGFNSWSELWTREENAGKAEIVMENVYGGTKTMYINHWDDKDWSFAYSQMLEVNTGEIYEYAAWTYSEQIADWVEISVVLYDSSFNVINWSYGLKRIIESQEYKLAKSRFVIPENIKYILPRITGNDSSSVYVDDVSLILDGTSGQGENLVLQNDFLNVEISSSPFLFKAITASNNIYESQSNYQFNFTTVDTINGGYALFGNYIPENLEVQLVLTLNNNSLKFKLSADSSSEISQEILFPGEIQSKAEDYFIVPRAAGMIFPADYEYPYWRIQFYGHKATMSFIGSTNLESGYMILAHNPWDTEVELIKGEESQLHSPQLIHNSSKGRFGYSRVFEYYFYDEGGYISMTKDYRKYAENSGYVKTFNDKISDNPNVEKLIGAVDFWALQPEFRSSQFMDSLELFGVEKALISLGGSWYTDTDMSQLIDTINAKGYLSSRYDIFTDVWPPDYPQYNWIRTDGYPEDVIIKKNGDLQEGWLTYLEGTIPFQGYYTSSATHYDLAMKRISEDPSGTNYSARFIDVELSSRLFEDYSGSRPQTRQQDALDRNKTLGLIKNEFNLVTGSEEARDWAFPNVDFGEGTMSIEPAENAGYDWSTPIDDPGDGFIDLNMNPALRIPLHGLVYHDVHVPTWYTGDGVSKVPEYWDDKDLFNILYGTMPLMMPPSYKYWLTNRERFLNTYHLVCPVFEKTGTSKMTSHSFLSEDKKVQETQFENRWTVAVNFNDESYNYSGIILAPKGFYASNGEEYIYKTIEDGFTAAVAELENKIFINSESIESEYLGVRSSGSVLFEFYDGYFDISLLGNQEYIDLNPTTFPEEFDQINVFSKRDSEEVEVEILSDDWYQVKKQEDERFYRAYYLLTDIEDDEEVEEIDDGLPKDFALFQNYPNPFNPTTTISYQLPKEANVKIEVFNVLGNKVEKLLDEKQPSGFYNIEFDASNHTSGIYFYRITADEFSKTKKMILVK